MMREHDPRQPGAECEQSHVRLGDGQTPKITRVSLRLVYL